jgi:hypothetical protein
MSHSVTRIVGATLLAAGVGVVALGDSNAQPAPLPSLQDIQAAQVVIQELQTYVATVIRQATEGGGSRGCSEYTTSRSCERAECLWDDGRCVTPENDTLALQVLLTIQSRLVEQGAANIAAAQAYPSPAFVAHVAKECQITVVIISLAREGQDLADWPAVGFITRQKFEPTFEKENTVRRLLKCQ